jgi:hypothetical protein
VNEFPWRSRNDPKKMNPAGAMMWAFGVALKLWLQVNGGGTTTTDTLATLSALRSFVLKNESGFGDGITQKRWGRWVLESLETQTERIVSGEEVESLTSEVAAKFRRATHVDIRTTALTDPEGMGLTEEKVPKLLAELLARRWLEQFPTSGTTGKTIMRNSVMSRLPGEKAPVRAYRIKAEFFGE